MWVGAFEIWHEIEAAGWANLFGPLFDYLQRIWLPRSNELCVFGWPERTNNCSESDNHAISSVLPQNHPNTWRLLCKFIFYSSELSIFMLYVTECILLLFSAGIVQLEYLAWCDKLAVDAARPVNSAKRWRTIRNDSRVEKFTDLLMFGRISPGLFLHRVSYVVLGGVNHGLRHRRNQQDEDSSEEETDSDSD